MIPVPGEARRKININPEMVEFEEDGTFSVPSETKRDVFYSVSMELRTCTTCPQGMLKGPCKHRTVVSLSQNLPSFDVVPELNPEMRKMWMYIGTGKHIDLDYFLPLSNPKDQDQEAPTNMFDTWNMESQDGEEVQEMDLENTQNDNQEQRKKEEPEREKEDARINLDSALVKMKSIFGARIDEDPQGYNKALKIFAKHLDQLPKTNDAALQKAVCTFGQESIAPLRHKNKRSHLIPVQVGK